MLVRPGHISTSSAGTALSIETHAPSGSLDPHALRLLVQRHLRLVGSVFAATLLAGVAFLILMPSRYTATAVVLVDPRQQRVVQSEAVLPGIGNDMLAVESQVEVIRSTGIARRVIDELNLAQDIDHVPSALTRVASALRALLPMLGASDREREEQRLMVRFEEDLRVQRRGQTYVLEIGYVSRDPERAAAVANAVARAYLDQQVTMKRDATTEASGWLDGRLADLRRQADAADRAVADYRAAHNLADTGDRSGQRQTLIEQQLADVNAQLVQARVKASDVQSRFDQVRRASPDAVGTGGLPEALQSPVILALRSQYAGTARNVAEMMQVYGPRHPAIRTGQAELDELRRQLSGELSRIAAGLRNELDSAKARVRTLEGSLKASKSQSADTDQDSVKLRELQREAEATRTVLAQSLLRYRETTEQQSLQAPDARVLSPASAPLRPSSPNAPLVLGLASLAGLVLGIGAAVAADRLTRTVRSTREIEDLLSLPVLALLPEVPQAALVGRPLRRGEPPLRAARDALDRFALDHPLSRFGEAVRGLAIRLRGARGDGSVMLVASALPGEGASTVAVNIARTTARGGTATLLIHADLRGPAGPGSRPGLFEALRDGTPPHALLRRDPDSGLQTLPAGLVDDPGRASQMLTGRAMDRVLATLRPSFELVVIDATPILSSVDSRALLDLADTALLVVAWADTPRDSLEAALDAAGLNADKFRGIVLNRVDLEGYRAHDDAPQVSAQAAAA